MDFFWATPNFRDNFHVGHPYLCPEMSPVHLTVLSQNATKHRCTMEIALEMSQVVIENNNLQEDWEIFL